ncbi:MAG: zinc ribbon domain-containing protein [Treponema sp.]|nr:zinc ribbon domain-containing protein [Treponema sp.]
MKEKKSAKFFCEHCGSEVKANARFCPKCGKFFAAVRCPECGKLGSVSTFKQGCPRCHYAMTKEDLYGFSDSDGNTGSDGLEHKLSRSSKRKIREAFKKHEETDDIPSWFIAFGFFAFVLVFVLFLYKCR